MSKPIKARNCFTMYIPILLARTLKESLRNKLFRFQLLVYFTYDTRSAPSFQKWTAGLGLRNMIGYGCPARCLAVMTSKIGGSLAWSDAIKQLPGKELFNPSKASLQTCKKYQSLQNVCVYQWQQLSAPIHKLRSLDSKEQLAVYFLP